MNHKSAIEVAIKAVTKAKEASERDIRNLAEMRARLPEAQRQLDELKKVADVRNDEHISRFSRLHSEVEMITKLLEADPVNFSTNNERLAEAIESLNAALGCAGRQERESIILEAIKALAPFAGTKPKIGTTGDSFIPARVIAETLPILGQIPSDSSTQFASTITFSSTEEGIADSLVRAAGKALEMANQWLKADCRFAQYLN